MELWKKHCVLIIPRRFVVVEVIEVIMSTITPDLSDRSALGEVTSAIESWRNATIVTCVRHSWPFSVIEVPPDCVILSLLSLPKLVF
jgi:hypothetical protein